MKTTISILIMLISVSILAQSPCQDGIIYINGDAIDAVYADNANSTGLSFPLWVEAGATIAAGDRIKFISVIEFNEVNNAGNISLVYSRVVNIGTGTQTVPQGKVWKVEGFVKYANAFAAGFAASSNSPVCQGGIINLSATTIAGASYLWTGPNGFTSSVQNPVINNASLAATGTYSMTATLNGCTSNASTANVVVNTLPISTFTNDPALAIINYNINFYPTLTGASYTWTFDQGTPSTSTAENPVVQWSAPGNYDVTLTLTDNNGCISSTQQVITVSSCVPGQPSSAFTWAPSSPQPGQTVTFDPTTTGATYAWTFSGGSIGSSTDENPDVSWSNNGTYNVSLTVTSSGCSNTTAQNVVVKSPTVVTFNYTGSQQIFSVPSGVTNITVEVWGASGCNHGSFIGGKGGYAKGDLTVTPSQTLYIFVGQQGIDGSNSTTFGGGAGGDSNGGSGGGASDLRSGGNGLANRVIVAGGGGGAWGTGSYPQWDGHGGDGGGISGGNATSLGTGPTTGGMGGTQTSGGYKDGGFGVGGAGAYYGGGGGGWYGGGSADGSVAGAGGGGSGYIGGVTNGTMQSGVKTGNGQVIITY